MLSIKPEPEGISIIIAAKNEEDNLVRLLTSIAQFEIPDMPYEVIIVNDHSEDGSMRILEQWEGQYGIKVIDFQDELEGYVGKKAALQKGIEAAKYDILAFSDADCKLPVGWLNEIGRNMDKETDYLLGYSTIYRFDADEDMRLVNFERSVYYILAAAGLAYRKPITASACNMVYRKSLFEKAGGFEGISHLRSGDDDLLLMKMMPFARKVAYNPAKEMQVDCVQGKSIGRAYHRNIRRASKFQYFPSYLQALSAYIFLYFVLSYVAYVRLALGKGDILLLSVVVIKSAMELALCQWHLSLVKKTHLGILYFAQVIVFPLQFVFYAVRGTLGGYRWK